MGDGLDGLVISVHDQLRHMHQLGYHYNTTSQAAISIDQESRFQHTYVIGQTGTGKSTFAKDSFLQDIHAGFGGCFFDFHGQDAPWLLDYIPPQRIKDVIYLDALDREYAIGYNVLDGVRPEDYSTFTDDIVASFRHIHSASWGARMDDILINAIRPLFDLPGESQGTILGAVRMLNDPYYRNWVVKQSRDQSARDFWLSEYANWSKGDKSHNLNSSLNKLRRLQSAPLLRNILGQQRSRIDFGRAIADGKIVILNMNKWRMGADNANTLASLIVSRLIYEGTRRPFPVIDGQVLNKVMLPFHVVIDEFQTITSLSAIEALSGIRKYRVGFTLCHQYTTQLPDAVLDAVKGNVGTKVVFRVGGEDALRLQHNMDVPNPKQLTELADYEFITQYKSGRTISTHRGYSKPLNFVRYGHSDAIRSLMRSKYALPVSEVEAKYERWMTTRHYGAVSSSPTVRRKESKSNPNSKAQTGLRSLSQIMLN